ncbi:uncharacterized protein EURHEDRAFT_50047 [Aspergillus ruber CBS 135680]|uniref:Uncharacterized protein n=1 Tax=Aspergillus ruber (strain CBS 135680) TaxID=1388766 RepID=A0A017SFF8_ASPRC|nr:uncharacterized protein EURHEDRAFT_50047 [Aspergillus ruber CBS 135680]EYE95682.1 hypothetical protein EURHEDRAFT_50047 [Aspergillus ruber CBS 135680]
MDARRWYIYLRQRNFLYLYFIYITSFLFYTLLGHNKAIKKHKKRKWSSSAPSMPPRPPSFWARSPLLLPPSLPPLPTSDRTSPAVSRKPGTKSRVFSNAVSPMTRPRAAPVTSSVKLELRPTSRVVLRMLARRSRIPSLSAAFLMTRLLAALVTSSAKLELHPTSKVVSRMLARRSKILSPSAVSLTIRLPANLKFLNRNMAVRCYTTLPYYADMRMS